MWHRKTDLHSCLDSMQKKSRETKCIYRIEVLFCWTPAHRRWRLLSRHELRGWCYDEMHFTGVYYQELDALDVTSGWELTRQSQSTADVSTCFLRRNLGGRKTKQSLFLPRKTTLPSLERRDSQPSVFQR